MCVGVLAGEEQEGALAMTLREIIDTILDFDLSKLLGWARGALTVLYENRYALLLILGIVFAVWVLLRIMGESIRALFRRWRGR